MASRTPVGRIGNKRGFGGNLREEILEGAERLLAESGSREAVTLRAIAREAGIAAPSIYPHFPDRNAIVDEVVSRTFRQLAAACSTAAASAPPGRGEVEAISLAYVAFAHEQPGRYRILFERSPADIASPPHEYAEGIEAFGLLVRALESAVPGSPDAADPMLRAQTLFAALHGIATLLPALPGFPWRDEAVLIRAAVGEAVATSAGAGSAVRRRGGRSSRPPRV